MPQCGHRGRRTPTRWPKAVPARNLQGHRPLEDSVAGLPNDAECSLSNLINQLEVRDFPRTVPRRRFGPVMDQAKVASARRAGDIR